MKARDDSEALHMEIEALENDKEEPQKPIVDKFRNDYDLTCPNCLTTFQYMRYSAAKPKYCSECGQKFMWE